MEHVRSIVQVEDNDVVELGDYATVLFDNFVNHFNKLQQTTPAPRCALAA